MVRTGSRAVDRLIEATNGHDVDAMMECFRQDYRSEQPLHPEAGFSGREQVGENWALMFEEVPDLRLDLLRSAIFRVAPCLLAPRRTRRPHRPRSE